MKIAQVNSVCSGSTGRISAGVARVLTKNGEKSLLFYGRGDAANGIDCERIESGASFYLHTLYARLSDRQGFASTAATRKLVERIAAYKPDVIQLHNIHGYYLDYRVLFQYLKSAGTPVVWTLHDSHAFTGHCAFFDMADCNKWKHGCGNCPQKHAYPKSILLDRSARNYAEKRELFTGLKNLTIVSPSNWLKALAEQSFLGEYPIQTIHNGIDPDIFKPTGSDLRSRFGIGEAKLVLGVANIWEPRKGLPDFLSLAEKLGDAAKVVLIGLSDRQIKNLPRGVTGIRRTANARELAAWYTAADVFVNPTLEDNFPTTQIEALACGTPVVTYDTGGCAEALDETCGVVVSKGDIDGLEKGVYHACDLQAQDCLKRAAAFDQNDRFAEYAALYGTLFGKAKL